MSNPYRPQSAEILNDVWDGPNSVIKTSSDQLGTPGTGEPAHAGGSTGLIGWARDILAKIAAFGTSAAPSADVLSVQYPNAYVGKATLGALNAAFTVDTLGASQLQYTFPQGTAGGMTITFEGTNSNATMPAWSQLKWIQSAAPGIVGYATGWGVGQPALVDCAAFTQIRCRVTAYTSGASEVLAHRSYNPSNHLVTWEPLNNSTYSLQITQNTSVAYEDSIAPLAAGATFTGSTRVVAVGNSYFHARANSDVASAASGFEISETPDISVNWRSAARGSVTAGEPVPLKIVKTGDNTYRVRYTNGASPQTWFLITSSQTPN